MASDYEILDFQVGQTFKTSLNGMSSLNTVKIHITHVLDGVYEGEKLVVFKWYGKRTQWWQEDMYNSDRLSMYIGIQTSRNKG